MKLTSKQKLILTEEEKTALSKAKDILEEIADVDITGGVLRIAKKFEDSNNYNYMIIEKVYNNQTKKDMKKKIVFIITDRLFVADHECSDRTKEGL